MGSAKANSATNAAYNSVFELTQELSTLVEKNGALERGLRLGRFCLFRMQ